MKGVKAAVAGIPLLPHPAPPPTQGELPAEAAAVISRYSGTIMSEWLKRVQREKVLGSPANVPARVLMDNISVWMIGLVSVLRYESNYVGTAEIRQKLAGHILLARGYGVNVTQIIKQFEILRDLVWETLEQSSLANLTTHDVFQLAKTINTALDEVMVQVAQQYEEKQPPAKSAT